MENETPDLIYGAMLKERLRFIKEVIEDYGEENFVLSFSGGKDSTVLSELLDMAIPNQIPRVYADTGIELNMIRQFVLDKQKNDDRIIIIKPSHNIKEVLETEGYPFKSKGHSEVLERYQTKGMLTSVKQYLGIREDKDPWSTFKSCPQCLKYQFNESFKIKVSDKCCLRLKEDPILNWQKEHKRPYAIVGLMRDEGGRRSGAVCLAFRNKKLKAFQPMVKLTKDWEEWFIKKYNIDICPIYYPPYNYTRTGCKGCPFNPTVEKELETLKKFFPAEYKQCEYIWQPIYEEYRRIHYRLK